ncbi:MAG: NUDIX hydrolase [Candidatus Omnitrophica bacterium]|nr:NUDIX hydrolase [Candidatus Omnitrophota bacterium]
MHILNSVSPEAKAFDRIDRKIAEKFGFIHETANVVLVTPDGKVLLQLRNKDNFDDHLAMYGGHLAVGESHHSGALEETLQETRLKVEELESEFK